jgi:hypothetical protein
VLLTIPTRRICLCFLPSIFPIPRLRRMMRLLFLRWAQMLMLHPPNRRFLPNSVLELKIPSPRSQVTIPKEHTWYCHECGGPGHKTLSAARGEEICYNNHSTNNRNFHKICGKCEVRPDGSGPAPLGFGGSAIRQFGRFKPKPVPAERERYCCRYLRNTGDNDANGLASLETKCHCQHTRNDSCSLIK